ncbi:glycosyltransferase [Kineococcus glutinatus]|uniref:Glycosyltransferase 2-like domain-containing protein n=1 Tax=Kineococcus glutinatus TaxID=1070872 RepID=A0ABP9HMB2_9ACTN
MSRQPAPAPLRVLGYDLITREVETPATPDGPEPATALVLVRWRGRPLGLVEVPNGSDDLIASRVDEAARELHSAELDAEVPLELSRQPLLSVVVATLRNPEAAVRCVRRILDGDYPHVEVLLVDNDDSPLALRQIAARTFGPEDPVVLVHEPRRGLSRARNAGLAAAEGEFVVFTDDDVLVDRGWARALVGALLSGDDVACATGPIIPSELVTPSQRWLEEYGGFSKGFERKKFNLTTHRLDTPLFPFDSGKFGSGANLAFRTDRLRQLGGFAEDLGAGTLAHGGEDLDVLLRTVRAGHSIVYEPSALLWHAHRRSYEALRRQMYRYGVGLSATVTKWMLEDRRTAGEVLSRVPAGLGQLLNGRSAKNARKSTSYPRVLSILELVGVCAGPVAYVRSRRRTAQRDASAGN